VTLIGKCHETMLWKNAYLYSRTIHYSHLKYHMSEANKKYTCKEKLMTHSVFDRQATPLELYI